MELVAIITDQGRVVKRKGEAVEGAGIIDCFHNWHPAGLDANGNIYASNSDDKDNVLTMDGSKVIPGYKLTGNYKHLLN